MNKCIAIDLGASSGRIIEGELSEDRIELKEIHRFRNEMISIDGQLCWDLSGIFDEIITGLKKCSDAGISPECIGVDSWGVDFVLLDEEDKIIGNPVAYRDSRTDGVMDEVFRLVTKGKIYERTGIQFIQFNTLFQLYALKDVNPNYINRARTLLFIPDYINFLLTGRKTVEYTIASTSQLLNISVCGWDSELTRLITENTNIFKPVTQPGYELGPLLKPLEIQTGLESVKVMSVSGHDTACAVAAVPADGNRWAYISSGTWSLMGVELTEPVLTEKALKYNFTNEGGVSGTIRLLKNLMGLWLFQESVELFGKNYSFDDLISQAERAAAFRSLINPNDRRFFNPADMLREIMSFCEESGQPIPETPGEICRCIFDSLAFQYLQVLNELRQVQERSVERIRIVGGGSQNNLLNQLCADVTGLDVYAGPVEATALGNIIMQLITLGKINSLEEGRGIIRNGVEVKKFTPVHSPIIEEKWQIFRRLVY